MTSIAMASTPKDVTNFRFVQMRPVQLQTDGLLEADVFKKPTQLLAIGNRIGIVFAGDFLFIRNTFFSNLRNTNMNTFLRCFAIFLSLDLAVFLIAKNIGQVYEITLHL